MNLSETHYLGRKAFVLFLMRRAKLVGLILVVSAVSAVAQYRIPAEYAELAWLTALGGLALSAVVTVARVIQTYIEYRSYSYKFDEEFFQVNFGYFEKNEIAIVYHHIQNAIIKRDLFDRMVGVSKLVVVMDGGKEGRGNIVLPAIDRTRAKLIQKELMRQARIHSIRESKGGLQEEEEDEYVFLGPNSEA